MTRATGRWSSEWEPGTVPPIAYGWCPADSGEWVSSGDGFLARDLGLAEASNGLLSARQVRADNGSDGAETAAWRTSTADYRFWFVLAGSAQVELGSETVALRPWSAVCLRPGSAYRFTSLGPDFLLLEIQSTAAARLSPGGSGTWDGYESHDAEEAYTSGDGPRAYFAYRDLGTRTFTDRRIHTHIVRASEPVSGGTGWHNHTMSQWVYVLRGVGAVSVAGHGEIPLAPGDCMCLGVGTKHDVSEFSDDYTVLEMCVPAEYETASFDGP